MLKENEMLRRRMREAMDILENGIAGKDLNGKTPAISASSKAGCGWRRPSRESSKTTKRKGAKAQ